MAPDTFLVRPRTRVHTSAGETELPVLYGDSSVVTAFFRVDPRRAAEVLGDAPLAPVRFAGGTALAGISAYDYRDTSIGPYREVAVAIAVVPTSVHAPTVPLLHLLREPAHADVGWHVVDLPVTTATADVSGRELYGFPKFVTAIDVATGGEELRAVVRVPAGEEPLLVLQGRAGPGLPLGAMDLVLYTVLNGELLRTVVEARGRMHTGLGHGLTVHVGATEHPMARRLVALGLDGARPFAAQVCRSYRAVLNAAAPFRALLAHAA